MCLHGGIDFTLLADYPLQVPGPVGSGATVLNQHRFSRMAPTILLRERSTVIPYTVLPAASRYRDPIHETNRRQSRPKQADFRRRASACPNSLPAFDAPIYRSAAHGITGTRYTALPDFDTRKGLGIPSFDTRDAGLTLGTHSRFFLPTVQNQILKTHSYLDFQKPPGDHAAQPLPPGVEL